MSIILLYLYPDEVSDEDLVTLRHSLPQTEVVITRDINRINTILSDIVIAGQ